MKKVRVYKKAIKKCLHNMSIVCQCSKCGKIGKIPDLRNTIGTLDGDYNEVQMWDCWRDME